MKYLTIITLILLSSVGYSNEASHTDKSDTQQVLHTYTIPVTDETEKALSKLLKNHLKDAEEPLTEFFQMQGICSPEGSSSSLNSKKKLVTITNTHKEASIIVALLGDLYLAISNGINEEGLSNRYGLSCTDCGCWGDPKKSDKNKGEPQK